MNEKPTVVAVCGLIDSDGRLFLNQRPKGKICAGFWELPGGKQEVGETVDACLRRELKEELNIIPLDAKEIDVIKHHYPHAYVELHIFKTTRWKGSIESKEEQRWGFFAKDEMPSPILEATVPIIPRFFG